MKNTTINDLLNSGFEYDLIVRNRKSNGRVSEMEITIPGKTITARGYQIRKVLADKKGRALPSNLFFILKTNKDADDFYIIGAGFGHGRGLCQWGAIGMALKNYPYKDILGFYYPEFEIQKVY